MHMIVGLGNPGRQYEQSKHNTGFDVIDELAKRWEVTSWQERMDALVAQVTVDDEKIILVKPQTFMNDSGRAVGPLLSWYKLGPEDLMVVHDDMDIPAGTVRIRRKGSAGGHNGIKSILAHVGDENFARVRIGIGRPSAGWTVVNHVLAAFSEEDVPKIHEAIQYLIPAVECIAIDGIDLAMNRYNPKKQKKQKKAEPEMAPAGEEA